MTTKSVNAVDNLAQILCLVQINGPKVYKISLFSSKNCCNLLTWTGQLCWHPRQHSPSRKSRYFP